MSQTVLAARWLLRCSGERGRPPQALFPQLGAAGAAGRGVLTPPKHPAAFWFGFAFALLGWVLLGRGVFFVCLFFKN